jgi:predicted  nucleic acid-binding Zn-ribbon protein
MAVTLDEALRRLDAALGLIEAAVARRLDAERRRGDLETELQIMQDDRARLAMELDGAAARLSRMEDAAQDVERRVGRAIGTIRDVLARSEPDDPRE